jgi:alpha-1,3-glucan synthase
MPGWWYMVESMTTSHLVHQFRQAIQEALATKTETRAMMRARSAKQRFPVAQWVESLEILQTTAIRLHDKVATEKKHSTYRSTPNSRMHSRENSSNKLPKLGKPGVHSKAPESGLSRKVSLGSHRGPGHVSTHDLHDGQPNDVLPTVPDAEIEEQNYGVVVSHYGHDVEDLDDDQSVLEMPRSTLQARRGSINLGLNLYQSSTPTPRLSEMIFSPAAPGSPATPGTPSLPGPETTLLPPTPTFLKAHRKEHSSANLSVLSLDSVVGEKTGLNLQKVDPFFTDSNGQFTHQFEKKLETLDGKNSDETCIEEFLVKSEKKWFDEFRNAKLGRLSAPSSRRSSFQASRARSLAPSIADRSEHAGSDSGASDDMDQFMLGKDYVPPTGARNWMQRKM